MSASISTLSRPATERASSVPEWLRVVCAVEAYWLAYKLPARPAAIGELLESRGEGIESPQSAVARLGRCGWLRSVEVDDARGWVLSDAGRAELERMRGQGEAAA